jgi:hypothetical protein
VEAGRDELLTGTLSAVPDDVRRNLFARTMGCATARNKGTCDNLLTIKRPFVEACVLNGLRDHLMDRRIYEIFCEE